MTQNVEAQHHLEAGNALYDEANYEKAIEEYKKAIEFKPDYADAYNRWGNALFYLKKYEDAIEKYQKAIEFKPDYADAYNNWGDTLFFLRRYEEAIKTYDKALGISPQRIWINPLFCRLAYLINAIIRFIKGKQESWGFQIPLQNSLVGKGSALHKLKRYNEAIKAYDKTLIINSQNLSALDNKGNALENLGKHEKAVKAFEKAVEISDKYIKTNPQISDAWVNRGFALFYLERYEEAIRAFKEVLKLNPEKADLYNIYLNIYLGEVYFRTEELDEASKEINEVLKVDENNAWALRLNGRIKIKKEEYSEAKKCFKKAISLDLGNPLNLLWCAYTSYLKAKFSSNSKDNYQEKIISIIRTLDTAKELSKNKDEELQAKILYFSGFLYYTIRDYYTAKSKLEECITLRSMHLKSMLSIKKPADELLGYIWYYQIRPSWWQWWLYSPWHKLPKFIAFCFLLVSLPILLLLYPLIPFLNDLRGNQTFYIILIALLIATLFFPSIKSFKANDVELELRTPPKFVLSPSALEEQIMRLDPR